MTVYLIILDRSPVREISGLPVDSIMFIFCKFASIAQVNYNTDCSLAVSLALNHAFDLYVRPIQLECDVLPQFYKNKLLHSS